MLYRGYRKFNILIMTLEGFAQSSQTLAEGGVIQTEKMDDFRTI